MDQNKLLVEPFIPISTPTCIKKYEDENKKDIISACRKRCSCPAFIS